MFDDEPAVQAVQLMKGVRKLSLRLPRKPAIAMAVVCSVSCKVEQSASHAAASAAYALPGDLHRRAVAVGSVELNFPDGFEKLFSCSRSPVYENSSATRGLLDALVSPTAFAISSDFTYQGRLVDADAPANGTYDLQPTLQTTAGVPIGVALVRSDVPACCATDRMVVKPASGTKMPFLDSPSVRCLGERA